MKARIPPTREQVRLAYATHRTLAAAGASLGLSRRQYCRLRRHYGLVEADRAAKRELQRAVLGLPACVAALALGRTTASVYRLRKELQITPATQTTNTPQETT